MKVILFAGGSGTRFWPISRKKFPKQFIKLTNSTSTFQGMVKRYRDIFGWNNIFISTNEKYISIIKEQVPQIPISNIFAEPAKRDVGPAAGLALIRLRKMGVTEPIAISWADHLIGNESAFQSAFLKAERHVQVGKAKIVFVGEKPTFGNENVGWIKIGNEYTKKFFQFKGFEYRPPKPKAQRYFKSKKALWNTGYFVSTVDYLLSKYEKHNKKMYKKLLDIEESLGTSEESSTIDSIYPVIKPIHFDHAVLYHVQNSEASVLKTNMKWDDPGTLYALKKFFEPSQKNVEKGKTFSYKCKDSFIYNYEDKKLIVGYGLDGMIVVNTPDALLVTPKESVRFLGELLKKMEDEKLEKYL